MVISLGVFIEKNEAKVEKVRLEAELGFIVRLVFYVSLRFCDNG